MELTILMPCLNEADTIFICVDKALKYLKKNNINGEVLIIDNGSIDSSINIIKKTKARLIIEHNKGYGNALRRGIKEAKGKYIIMGDSDDTYDFNDLNDYLTNLRLGYDLVIGNRFKGGIEPSAMPLTHKIGVPLLTIFANIIYGTKIGDYHCGLRGINKTSFSKLDLECEGMDFASEMIIKAKKSNYKIIEIPTTLRCSVKNRKSHLNTIKDGMKHLKCIMKYR